MPYPFANGSFTERVRKRECGVDEREIGSYSA
jgi:hypothetical protein